MAQLLVDIVCKARAVKGAGAGSAGAVAAAQQALGHGHGGSAQGAGPLIIRANQSDVLGGHVAGLDLIPAVAGIGHNVHQAAALEGGHLVICSGRAGADIEHAGGNQAPLLLGLGALGGGDDGAVRQGDGEPLGGHIAGLSLVADLVPAVAGVLLHGNLGALGGLGQNGAVGARPAAHAQGIGGDGGAADGGERHASAHGEDNPGCGHGLDRLHFQIHWYDPH